MKIPTDLNPQAKPFFGQLDQSTFFEPACWSSEHSTPRTSVDCIEIILEDEESDKERTKQECLSLLGNLSSPELVDISTSPLSTLDHLDEIDFTKEFSELSPILDKTLLKEPKKVDPVPLSLTPSIWTGGLASAGSLTGFLNPVLPNSTRRRRESARSMSTGSLSAGSMSKVDPPPLVVETPSKPSTANTTIESDTLDELDGFYAQIRRAREAMSAAENLTEPAEVFKALGVSESTSKASKTNLEILQEPSREVLDFYSQIRQFKTESDTAMTLASLEDPLETLKGLWH